jgi:hypothetical protein
MWDLGGDVVSSWRKMIVREGDVVDGKLGQQAVHRIIDFDGVCVQYTHGDAT